MNTENDWPDGQADEPATGRAAELGGPAANPAAEPGEPAASAAGSSRWRGRGKRFGGAIVAMSLLGGGVALGTTLPDPTSSEAYRKLAAEKTHADSVKNSVQSDYVDLRTEYKSLRAQNAATEKKIASRESEVGRAETALKSAEAAVKKREEAVTGAEQEKAANTISDGTWTVEKDIAAGAYRATADVGGSCYWGIYQTGSNGENIIQNDIPGGGRPTVVLSAGQDFKSKRCGTWEKQ